MKHPKASDVVAAVRESGVCTIRHYAEHVQLLQVSTRDLFNSSLARDYPYGKSIREMGTDLRDQIPDIFALTCR